MPTNPRAPANAKLLLVVLSVTWGVTWPVLRIALDEFPPFTMRTATSLLGAATIFLLAAVTGRSLAIPRGPARWHIAVAGLFNVAGLNLLSAFAQIGTATSRVTILIYAMPIWASLLARPMLGERIDWSRGLSLALCVAGLIVLITPLAGTASLVGVLLGVAGGISWAIGTVYLKWARIDADLVGIAAWQLVIGFFMVAALWPFFEGMPNLHAHPRTVIALIFSGVVGSGLAFFLWFGVVQRLPAMTASLAVLSVPVVSVIASALLLDEWPSVPDMVGFALILAAASCVMLAPHPASTAPVARAMHQP